MLLHGANAVFCVSYVCYAVVTCRYCADIAGLLPGYQNSVHEADICGRS